jgi:methionyl-tRNA formyltransferase
MFMNERMDAGDIIFQEEVAINPDETAGELETRLMELGAQLLVRTLRALEDGSASRTPQNDSEATMAPKIKKPQTTILWKESAFTIAHLIRGLSPHPGAHTIFRGRRLKLLRAVDRPVSGDPGPPGAIAGMGDEILVWTSDGLVAISELQVEGKRPVGGKAFVQGYHPQLGECFGVA